MQAIAIFLGMSLSVGGVGGLLSGIFARSLKQAMFLAIMFGVLDVIILFLVSPTSRFVPVLVLVAVFWGLIGWFVLGRFMAKRRAAKASM